MDPKLLFGGITRILGPPAVNEIKLLWGVKGAIRKLGDTISTIEDMLLDAEEKHAAGDRAVTNWLRRLEDAIFDADNLLDAISIEALRRQIMTHEKKAKQVRIFCSKSNQLVYHIKKAHKIKAISERLDAIAADGLKFLLVARNVEETRVGGNSDRGNTHSSVCAEEVFGREEDKKAIINRLLDPNVVENVSIHPIVGIGGLGKTTLAKLIFNDKQFDKKYFEPKMWVCVSDPFDVINVVEKILEAATRMKPEAGQMETLVGKLKERIDGKKYFLVLDDVWNEDSSKWLELKQMLMGGASGSIILVTTRNETVATISGTVPSYSLGGLDEHASWSLFKQLAFEKRQEPKKNSSIADIGREILAKCSGVPLAIKTIGSLLLHKKSEAEWLSFKNNEFSKISQKQTDILPTLRLSYDHLPSHLKHCFAYCCLFPKDYKFQISTLIRLWIAQGFVKSSDQNPCLEVDGNDYFMYLLRRSFFQEAKTDEFGTVINCKMHDLMHDLAISVAGSMITSLDGKERKVDEKTRHVSIVSSDIDALSFTTSLCKASRKRTLIFHSTSLITWADLDSEAMFSSSKFLRVLDIHEGYVEILPTSIEKLKHLRYLDLSSNYYLEKLPNSITRLQNLQTLRLSNCTKLEELPRDIKKLVNLRHLEIDRCDSLTYMPCGLGQLTNLQTLSNFVVDKDPLSKYSSGLTELNGLNNLRGELCIKNLRHGNDVASECTATILKEKHLHGLDLQWSIEGGVDDEVLLKILQPQPNLKRLRLEGNICSRLPSWLSSLTKLVRFVLIDCRKCPYLPPLSQLLFLKYLYLSRLDDLEYISDSKEFSSSSSALVQFFPSLEQIELCHCPNLKGWWRRRDSSIKVSSDTNNAVEIMEHPLPPTFPCLSSLNIVECPMLTSMPMFPHLEEKLCLKYANWMPVQQTMMKNMAAPQSPTSRAIASPSSTPLSKLKLLVLLSLPDLETLPEEGWKNLTSLSVLKILDCKRLSSVSPGIQHLSALKAMSLYNCPELVLANDEDGMHWQGLKSLFVLMLEWLPKLVSLPLGLQHSTTLNHLIISHCENLIALPEWINNCTSLQKCDFR